MVHLGFNVWLWRQLSMKINMPKKVPDHTKVWSGKLNSKDTQLSHINPGHFGGTLWIYINGSTEVPWGWNIQFQSQMSMNHTKVKDFSHMLNFFRTNLRHLGGILSTSRNCSRVVHWEWDKHLLDTDGRGN